MVIHGNFKYHTVFYSLEEMISDESLRKGYVVYVVEKKQGYHFVWSFYIDEVRWYNINCYQVVHGLWANIVSYSGRIAGSGQSSNDEDLVFTTKRPTEVQVGGIEVGSEFTNATLQDVLDRMLYSDSGEIQFTVKDNLSQKLHIIGLYETNTKLIITVSELNHPVNHITVKRGTEVLIDEDIQNWDVGIHEVNCNFTVGNDTVLEVTLTDTHNNFKTIYYTIDFTLPCYVGVCVDGAEPSSYDIQRMNQVDPREDYTHRVSLSGNNCFLAVPNETTVLENIKDENDLNVTTMFTTWLVTVHIGALDHTYTCYRSRALSVSDFRFIYSFREI